MIPVIPYGLFDPRDGVCRYVGQSSNPNVRFKTHLRASHSILVREWIDELATLGMKPEMKLLDHGDEAVWIRRLHPDLNRGHAYAGRPPRYDAKSVRIHVSLTDDMLNACREAAKRTNQSLASWARDVLSDAASKLPTERLPMNFKNICIPLLALALSACAEGGVAGSPDMGSAGAGGTPVDATGPAGHPGMRVDGGAPVQCLATVRTAASCLSSSLAVDCYNSYPPDTARPPMVDCLGAWPKSGQAVECVAQCPEVGLPACGAQIDGHTGCPGSYLDPTHEYATGCEDVYGVKFTRDCKGSFSAPGTTLTLVCLSSCPGAIQTFGPSGVNPGPGAAGDNGTGVAGQGGSTP